MPIPLRDRARVVILRGRHDLICSCTVEIRSAITPRARPLRAETSFQMPFIDASAARAKHHPSSDRSDSACHPRLDGPTRRPRFRMCLGCDSPGHTSPIHRVARCPNRVRSSIVTISPSSRERPPRQSPNSEAFATSRTPIRLPKTHPAMKRSRTKWMFRINLVRCTATPAKAQVSCCRPSFDDRVPPCDPAGVESVR